MARLSQVPAVVDLTVYVGDAWDLQVSFTENGAPYEVNASDFQAVLSRQSDVALTIQQVDGSTLKISGAGQDTGDYRWRLHHTSTDRTWLAGWVHFVTIASAGTGSRELVVNINGTTLNVSLEAIVGVEGPVGPSGGLSIMGDPLDPIMDAATAKTTTGPSLWYMANGITPTNAETGDIIWNANA